MAAVLSGPKQADEEEDVEDSPIAELIGMRLDKITKCGKCQTKTTTDNLLLLCNLVYPEHSTLKRKHHLVQSSAPACAQSRSPLHGARSARSISQPLSHAGSGHFHSHSHSMLGWTTLETWLSGAHR
eukprot:TRINITY_DN10964_c0_g1_i1.p1 TRINITY_DN10964_c0_g1~~TRINITY_DN10964_c0_g1_i1.p1  ORF type:complete len:149 (+),score=35.29 TRINITY_DN10964_c0_g1_i1:68-448(+)